jgi:alanine dehydrogenase
MQNDPGLKAGLNVCVGKITHAHLAEDLGMAYIAADIMMKH